ncbi:MAG: hypothetical protein OEZ29_05770 [Candidatus Bathyarchaeota archaeon]|nr:hypothetical protein [Candidatus Bathyarchaeota archaeon]
MKSQLRARIRTFPFATLICGLLLILPPISLLCYIRVFGVNVIFWDDWENVPLYQQLMSGKLAFSDLFAQHNEHRMLFPNIVMLAIENLTRYNTVSVMFFSWLLICAAGLLVFCVYQKQFRWGSHSEFLLFFLPVMLLYGFRQWESILWAITNQIYLMILGVVATFFLLEISKKTDIWFVLCILGSILASFSFLAGLAVWPIGLLQIVISERRKMLQDAALWCSASATVFISYFWGYVKPAHHPSLSYVLTEPLKAVEFFFTILGAPFSSDNVAIAEALGIVVALTSALIVVQLYREKLLRKNRIWLSLVLFTTLFSLIITVGRCGFGVEQALSSRYTPITILGVIGLYFLALSVFKKLLARGKSFGAYALLSLVLVGVIVIYGVGCYAGWPAGQQTKYSREMGAYILRTYRIQSDENIRNYLYPSPAIVRERAAFLEKNGLNVFCEPVINISILLPRDSTFFAIETINSIAIPEQPSTLVIHLGQIETVTITGWAVDKQANDVASTVFIIIDDKNIVPVFYGIDRPDVANNFGNTNFRASGYIATFSFSVLGKGVHSISLKIVSKDRHYYYDQGQVLSLIVD